MTQRMQQMVPLLPSNPSGDPNAFSIPHPPKPPSFPTTTRHSDPTPPRRHTRLHPSSFFQPLPRPSPPIPNRPRSIRQPFTRFHNPPDSPTTSASSPSLGEGEGLE